MHHRSVRHHRHGTAGSSDCGFANINSIIALGHLSHRMTSPCERRLVRITIEWSVIEPLRFKENDRIVIFNRRDEQALGIVRVRRHDGLDTTDVREHALRALRMRLPATNPTTTGRTDRHWRCESRGTPVAQSSQLADDLIVGGINVVCELNFSDRAQTVDTHTDSGADDATFGDRGIQHTMRSEGFLKSISDPEYATKVTDILTEHDNGSISLEHHSHRRVECLHHVHGTHFSLSICVHCSRK